MRSLEMRENEIGSVDASIAVMERALARAQRTHRNLQRARWSVCAIAAFSALLAFGFETRGALLVTVITAPVAIAFFRQQFWTLRADPGPFLSILRDEPNSIVWVFTKSTPELFGFIKRITVVTCLSDRRVLDLPATSSEANEILSALGKIAPGAEVGYSEARNDLYALNPKRPPRLRAGATGPQLAGVRCATCGVRIIVASDGIGCEKCDAPVHVDCLIVHAQAKHAAESGAPYRAMSSESKEKT